jgi:hypothetical protein
MVGGYRARPKLFEFMSRDAKAANALRLRTCGRLLVENTILERLPSHLQPVACECGQLIEDEDAVVRQRSLTGPGELPAADSADVGDGEEWGRSCPARGWPGGAPAWMSQPPDCPASQIMNTTPAFLSA